MSKFNPIPSTDIPGAKQTASNTYKKSADLVKILNDLSPYLSNITNEADMSKSLNDLAISQKISDPYAKLMTELYAKYGPQLNTIGNDIAKQNALSEIDINQAAIKNGGSDLVNSVTEMQKSIDPEYYATRANTASQLNNLFNSINLNGGLSNTERDEIQKGLAIEGVNRGTFNAPSNLETVANAMQYGQAGRNRILQNQNALIQAINASTAFIPTTKSGIDSFALSTGKTGGSNLGNNLFTGIATPSYTDSTSNLFNAASNIQAQRAAQSASKQKGNVFQGITSGAMSGASAGSVAGPWGAVIGGIAGGAMGGINANQRK